MDKHPDFEKYLMDIWYEEIAFTENDCLDNDIPEFFSRWLCELQPDDLIKYANSYVIELSIKNKLDKVYESAVINNKKEK